MSIFKRLFSSAKTTRFHRPERGLYASHGLSHGNTVSDFGNCNRRQWRPNAQYCSLYSELLQEQVRVRCTTGALKQIDRAGGLDSYILGQKTLESTFASKLKGRLLEARLAREQLNKDY